MDEIDGNLHPWSFGVADDCVTEGSRFELRFGGVKEGCERGIVARGTQAGWSVD